MDKTKALNVFENIFSSKTKLYGEPGHWCNKLNEWLKNEKKNGLVSVNYDLAFGDHNVEDVAKEFYDILSGQRECVDVTNEPC